MLRWLSLAALLIAWLAPRAAEAAALDVRGCLAAWGLAGLAPEEKEALVGVCSRRARIEAQLVPVVTAVATRGTWESAALGRLLVGGAPHLDLGTASDQAGLAGRLKALRQRLQTELVERRASATRKGDARCGWVREAFDAYAADLAGGAVPSPPIAGYALSEEGCLGLDPQWVGEAHFLTIAAEGASGLTVVAGTAERAVVQWFSPADAIVHEGRRIFVVAVPRMSVVTVEAQHASGLAARWHGFVARDLTVSDQAPAASCLRLSIDLDADTTLLLDGHPVTQGTSLKRQTFGVLGEGHELVGLRCGEGRCTESFREALAGAAGGRKVCEDIKLDLHRRSSVAVLGATPAPGCDRGLAYKVGVQAEDYLRASAAATGREFRDLKAVASATEALASLKESLNPEEGRTVGAATGADSMALLGTVAKEAWRQGIDSLLSFELRCEASGGQAGYRVVGSRLAVRDLLDRQRGEVAGLDLQRMVMVESLHVGHAAQISTAVAGVIDRLFALDYVRLLVAEPRVAYRRGAEVEVSVYGKALGASAIDPAPIVEATLIGDVGARPPICNLLARAERGAAERQQAQALLQGREGRRYRGSVEMRRGDAGEDEANPRSAVHVAAVRPGPPGVYLVTARWEGAPVLADAACITFEIKRSEVWGSVGLALDATTRAALNDYQWLHLRVMVGRTFYRWRPWFGLGVAGGYTLGRYLSREGLPTWQDVTVDPEGSDQPFEWTRHAVLVGPMLELRTRKATFPVELRGRVSVVGGLAIVGVGRLPQQFKSFVTRDPLNNPNVRFRPTFDVLLELAVTWAAGPVVFGQGLFFGAVGVNDMVSAKHAATAVNGGGLVFGLSMTIGGGV